MDYKELFLKYYPFTKRHILPLSLGFLGLIFFAYGLIGLFFASVVKPEEIKFEAASESASTDEKKTIFIDIEGAVVKPGLYELSKDSRVHDGLIAAGGLDSTADREFVAKNLNMAVRLIDGVKIYIPYAGEKPSDTSVLGTASTFATNLININSSSQSDLESLPGIGPVTAQKIISGRPYGAVDELLSKKVVGSKVFEQIKDMIAIF